MAEQSPTPSLTELVRRSTEPVNRRDYDAAMSFWLPDGVWDLTPIGLGVYEGRPAIRTFFEDWLDTYQDFRVELEEIREFGNGVVFVVLLQTGRPAGSVGSVQFRYASVAVWRDGLIQRCVQYSDFDEARAEAERLAAESRSGG